MKKNYLLKSVSIVSLAVLSIFGFAGCSQNIQIMPEAETEENIENHWFLTKSETFESGVILSDEEYKYNESGVVIYSKTTEYNYDGKIEYYNENEYNDDGLTTKTIHYTVYGEEHPEVTTTLYSYDENGNTVSKECFGNEDVFTGKTLFEYDSDGNEIRRTEYDENGNVSKEQISEYDDKGNLLLSERIMGDYYKVESQYDENGNEIQTEYYMGTGEEQSYAKIVCEYDDMNNQISKNTYNEEDILTSTIQREYYEGTDVVKKESNINYDDEGKIQYKWSVEYNENGDCIESTSEDSEGNKISEKNTYDKYGNITKEKWKDEDGSFRRTYKYDEYGRCIEVKKYKGLILVEANVTEYSEEGLLVKEIHTATETWISKEKIKETREYTYNASGKLVKEEFTGDEFYGDGSYEYEYDEDGNMILMSEKTNNGFCFKTVSYEYEYIA